MAPFRYYRSRTIFPSTYLAANRFPIESETPSSASEPVIDIAVLLWPSPITSKVTVSNCFAIADAAIGSVESMRMPMRPFSFAFTVSVESSATASPRTTRGFENLVASYSSVKEIATSSPSGLISMGTVAVDLSVVASPIFTSRAKKYEYAF